MYWFDYSIIRYCPSSVRGEIVNIGLVVFRNSGIDIRLINNSLKLKIVDSQTEIEDLQEFERLAKEICSLSEKPNEQFHTLKMLSTSVRISERNSFSIQDLSQYSRKIESLYDDFIKPYSTRAQSQNTSRLHTKIKREFFNLKILAKEKNDINNHKIVANYDISEKSGMTADFMLKNGKFHMTEVIDFNVIDLSGKMKETSMKMMTFIEGSKHISDDMGRYLVYDAEKQKLPAIINHLNLAEDYSDKMFNLSISSERATYFQLMKELSGGELKMLT